jgi:hypothetical protein
MNPTHYIACDLGAESGRVMLGRLEDGRLTLEEVSRRRKRPGSSSAAFWKAWRCFTASRSKNWSN